MRVPRTLPLVLLALACLGAAAAPPIDVGGLGRTAEQALREQRYADALQAYEQLRAALPERAEIPYNMGVAAYRGGDLAAAAEHFAEAADLAPDEQLRARAAYNLGTVEYARSLEATAGDDPAAAPADPNAALEGAMSYLRDALAQYRHALDDDPADRDAQANAELAQRRLRHLEELQEQLQQQQQQEQQQQQQQEQQDQQDQQQQQQEQQQQDQQQQDRQQQQQQQPQQQDQQEQQDQQQQQEQQQQQQQEQDRQQQQGQDEQQQQGDQQQQQSEVNAGDEQDADQAAGEAEAKPMSKAEAERLLQSVRDKERRRREELARRPPAGRAPVEKDW